MVMKKITLNFSIIFFLKEELNSDSTKEFLSVYLADAIIKEYVKIVKHIVMNICDSILTDFNIIKKRIIIERTLVFKYGTCIIENSDNDRCIYNNPELTEFLFGKKCIDCNDLKNMYDLKIDDNLGKNLWMIKYLDADDYDFRYGNDVITYMALLSGEETITKLLFPTMGIKEGWTKNKMLMPKKSELDHGLKKSKFYTSLYWLAQNPSLQYCTDAETLARKILTREYPVLYQYLRKDGIGCRIL